MNLSAITQSPRSRYLVAVIAGIALALAFPNFNIAGLAWVAPGLLLAAAIGTTGWRSFRIGYCGGLVFHLVTLRWLLNIPVTGFPILGWIALSAFLALYQAAWVVVVSSSVFRIPSFPDSLVRRQIWALSGAAAWVALEMIQARLFSGFPWHLLGVSQLNQTPLIQIASITGVYGISFVAVWAALSAVSAVRALLKNPVARYAWLGDLALPLLAVMGLIAFGMMQLRSYDEANRPTLRVAFVQPNIPQTMIWNAAENDQRFAELLTLTQQAATKRPDLILWPEAAMPGMLRYDEAMATNVLAFAHSNRVWMIVGSDDVEPAKHPTKPDDADSFNASFLINPDGVIAARYCKRNLVMFGEYIPLWRWVSFLKWFTPIEGGFAAGERVETFTLERRSPDRLDGKSAGTNSVAQESVKPAQEQADREIGAPIRTATLICFEDVFPQHVREYASDDTDFLVNLTNDGWFGEGAAQRQHAATAAFRCVENGIPLLRCCNNGLTCWIDSRGRIRQFLRDANGSEYGAGVMVAEIPLLAPGEKRQRTFYNQHGDWFGWSCVGVTLLSILPRLFARRAGRRERVAA